MCSSDLSDVSDTHDNPRDLKRGKTASVEVVECDSPELCSFSATVAVDDFKLSAHAAASAALPDMQLSEDDDEAPNTPLPATPVRGLKKRATSAPGAPPRPTAAPLPALEPQAFAPLLQHLKQCLRMDPARIPVPPLGSDELLLLLQDSVQATQPVSALSEEHQTEVWCRLAQLLLEQLSPCDGEAKFLAPELLVEDAWLHVNKASRMLLQVEAQPRRGLLKETLKLEVGCDAMLMCWCALLTSSVL